MLSSSCDREAIRCIDAISLRDAKTLPSITPRAQINPAGAPIGEETVRDLSKSAMPVSRNREKRSIENPVASLYDHDPFQTAGDSTDMKPDSVRDTIFACATPCEVCLSRRRQHQGQASCRNQQGPTKATRDPGRTRQMSQTSRRGQGSSQPMHQPSIEAACLRSQGAQRPTECSRLLPTEEQWRSLSRTGRRHRPRE